MPNLTSILLFLSLIALSSCNTEFVIRECISKLAGTQIFQICKDKDIEKYRTCLNSYFSMTLCLANNKCNEVKPTQEMPYDCWHCWAQLETESQDLKDFQKKIETCDEPYAMMRTLIFAMLGMIMFLAF